jgi:hypothetical protein
MTCTAGVRQQFSTAGGLSVEARLGCDQRAAMTELEIPPSPFTWAMAKEWGWTRRRLEALLARRELRRVLRNVYVRADQPDSPELRARAAHLVLSPVAVACDRTAAWLWGVDTFEYRELEVIPPVESCVLRGHNRTRRPEVSGRVRDLAPSDVVLIDGVACTSPLRTALDLACSQSRRQALAVLDAFMRHHGLTEVEMRRELVRYFRRRGVVQARELVRLADPRSESPGESWVRMDVIDHRLPTAEPQWWVTENGRPVYRLDLAWPKSRVAVEYDGREYHEDDVRRRRDEERRTWLRQRGWTVVVVTKDDFTAEAIGAWIGELREGLRLAA